MKKSEKQENLTLPEDWCDALQHYCDDIADKEGALTGNCVCGFMAYCDFCNGAFDENACVKAICAKAKVLGVKINCEDCDFGKLIKAVDRR